MSLASEISTDLLKCPKIEIVKYLGRSRKKHQVNNGQQKTNTTTVSKGLANPVPILGLSPKDCVNWPYQTAPSIRWACQGGEEQITPP
eukprot:9366567-Ditylum_brightwellii.AAC.1